MEKIFGIRPLAAILAIGMLGNACAQVPAAEVSVQAETGSVGASASAPTVQTPKMTGLQVAELITALGRLSVVAANVADSKNLNVAKYLHVAADSMRLLNEFFYLINKGFGVKEGAYYSAGWIVTDVVNLAKDFQKCIKYAPVLSSDAQVQSDVVDRKFEKVGRYLVMYVLPSIEASLAAVLAVSSGDSAKTKKARVILKSFESLSRSLQFFLSTKRDTLEAKIGLALVVTNIGLLCGIEGFKNFSAVVQQSPMTPTSSTPAVEQQVQTSATSAPEAPVAEQQTDQPVSAQSVASDAQAQQQATVASSTPVVEQQSATATTITTAVIPAVAQQQAQIAQQDVRNIAPKTVSFNGNVLVVDEYFEKHADGHWYYKKALGRSQPNTKVGWKRVDLLAQLNALN